MQVKHILHEKGSEIIGITGDATLSEAVCLLAGKRIGAVIVRGANGNLAGILSERDVVRAVAEESVAALARPVSAYMTRAVATCTEADSVDDLMEMMTRGRFRHVPVLGSEDRLIGIISIGDVVKSRIEETVREVVTLREYISASG
jgi:CBS domain-containing protein